MDSTAIVVPATMLTRLYLIALYLPVVCLGVSLLFPRLSVSAKVLAAGMLIGQIIFVLMTLEAEPASSLEKWLWYVEDEWNLPASFASLQMLLVGGVALAISWQGKEKPAWRRLYFVGLGLIFLFIALDDFTSVYKDALDTLDDKWKQGYGILGVLTSVLTVIVMLRAPRGTRICYLGLLLGLALIGAGGILLDDLSMYCGVWRNIRLGGCLTYKTLEEGSELLGTWLSLLSLLVLLSGADSRPPFRARRFLVVMAVFLLGLLASYALQLPQELRRRTLQYELANELQSVSVDYQSAVSLLSFQIERRSKSSAIGLYFSSAPQSYADSKLGMSIHLVDQITGDSVARRDERAGGKRGVWLFDTENSSVYRQWIEVEIPREAPVNRALWSVLAFWIEDGENFIFQTIETSDMPLLSDTQVILNEFVLTAQSPPATSPPLAAFNNGFSLQAVEVPARAQAGETLWLEFAWHSDEDNLNDYAQFLHFVHEASGAWWGFDQQPLGPRLPTRLWYQGLADSETWQVPLPQDLAPGSYTVYTGLYGIYDSERLPATDADAVPWPDNRVALGAVVVEQ